MSPELELQDRELPAAQQVDRDHPELLRQNIAATCFQFITELKTLLRARGHSVYYVCKTRGEGQYTPPWFQPREITGFDGLKYLCTGFSHDALWCDGLQFDCIVRANDSDEPIGMTASPGWNPIPKEYWRPQNPPALVDDVPVQPPTKPPVKPPVKLPYPGDAFFVEHVGVPLDADYARAGQALNAGAATWFARTIWDIAEEGLTPEASVKKHRPEWRAALGLE